MPLAWRARGTVAVLMRKAHTATMDDTIIRHCAPGDYDAIVRIYNHYIEHSSATFDTVPFSVGERVPWFAQFGDTGPLQLLVAERDGEVVAYCCSTPFKTRPAYDVSVETTIYVSPDVTGHGIGRRLYSGLLENIKDTGIHGAYAGVTVPNDASLELHRDLGFREIGTFDEVGFKFDQYWSVVWFEKRI